MHKPVGSEYINDKRRGYSLYVLQNRSIPAIADGLKPAARRVLWTARDGKKTKSATLAGATMPIHPHAAPESTINTLAAPYGNNVPLLTGIGAFGTLLAPEAYGASRYTSVKVSEFTKDVVFKDIEIIPMVENYDSTLYEPKHFLPLVPIALVNSSDGIAIGYATSVLPRKLEDIIMAQLTHLNGKQFNHLTPTFQPTNNVATWSDKDDKWTFTGEFERTNPTMIKITKLPYGLSHNKFVANERSKLHKLFEAGTIVDFDDFSKDTIDIRIKFKRGELSKLSDAKIMSMFGLVTNANENLNLLNFDGNTVLEQITDIEIIKQFTDWRLQWYVNRYERLKSMLEDDIQRYRDIITAIDNDAGKVAASKNNKKEYEQWLGEIGVVNLEYISSLPTYRYTIEEREKIESKLNGALKLHAEYVEILGSETKRKNIYKKELREVLKKYG